MLLLNRLWHYGGYHLIPSNYFYCADEDDWNVLISECHLLAAHWDKIAGFLGLDSSSIEVIKGNNPCNLAVSWNEALNQWIKQNYNTSRYGEPSWRSFLRAVVKVDKLQFKKMAIRHG